MRWLLPLSSSALLWTLLIAGIHRESLRTAISAHGFLHSAIAQRFWVDPFTLPPQNPFFAGEPLSYYWFFHALGAGLGAVLDLDPLRSFELLSLLATVALVAGCGWLTRALYGNAALGAVVTFLILVGANLQAPIVLGVRAWIGDPVPADNGAFLWGLAHPLLGHMRLWDPFALHGPLLPFYLNVTSRPLAYSALVFVLLGFHQGLARGGRTNWVLVVSSALSTALNPLVGLPAAFALAGAAVLMRTPALALLSDGHRPPLARAIGALALGVALGTTSFLHVFAGNAGATSVTLAAPADALRLALSMLASGWPLLALSALAIRASSGARRHFLSTLLLASLALAGGAAILELPVGNQFTLFHDALILLAVCACGAVLASGAGASPRRVVGVVVAFLPVLALMGFAYSNRPPVALAFEGRQLARVDGTHAARLYRWIRSSTPPDAVFVIDPSPPIRAMAGNTAELPALTERTLFTTRTAHYIVSSYPAANRRVAIARRLLSGSALSEADVILLQGLERPVYIVVDAASQSARPAALRSRYGRPDFESGPVRAWRWSRAASGI